MARSLVVGTRFPRAVGGNQVHCAARDAARARRRSSIHQGSGGFRGTPADIQIAAREILDMTQRMAEIIARHSGQDVEQVLRDIDRDRFMTPEEAVSTA